MIRSIETGKENIDWMMIPSYKLVTNLRIKCNKKKESHAVTGEKSKQKGEVTDNM